MFEFGFDFAEIFVWKVRKLAAKNEMDRLTLSKKGVGKRKRNGRKNVKAVIDIKMHS